jgi:L-asparagine transporter-like permease
MTWLMACGMLFSGFSASAAVIPISSIPPKANQVIFRILVFYVASLAIIMSLIPWNQLDLGGLDTCGMLFSGFSASAAVIPISSIPPKANIKKASI